ncbi:M48 family metallopeptidase [Streptomyces sp. ME19-01-6]|uniref:M48 family metallopeptidase n=1 Tax=Streptomyces sp. ME19-01-6 TaxID=3028686 RepID=UPI0029A196B3|nr:M48 family metallopeptidase [Streptomyces sp. ME19-01-6]MDX3227199.1 M48 family metallopeptidase [Streptomyces sp. ME19-01-6]
MIAAALAAARAVLALVLLVVFYVLVALLVLVWVAFLVLGLWSAGAPESTAPPTTVILACAAFAPIMAGMVWAVVRTARPAAPLENTVWVSRRRAPALWAAVEELAEGVGTAPPDAIRLTAEVNASVTEDATFLGLVAGRRTLYLGLPLVVGLPPAELRAVLAHELGHFSRRHSRFGALAYRGSAGLAAACEAIRSAAAANDLVRMYAGGPLLLLRGYTRVFRLLTRPVRRRQEIEADREAARATGARTVADALRSAAALEVAWLEFVAGFLTPVRRSEGRVPDDPFRAFAHMAEAPELREPFAALRARAAERPADRDDPHPDLATRISRLARLPERPAGTAGGDMAEPLDVPSGYARELARTLHAASGATPAMPWRDWLGLLAEHRATRLLRPLAEAVRTVEKAEGIAGVGNGEPTGLTIQRVLRLLDSGRRMPLARALVSRMPPDERATGSEGTGRDPLGLLAEALYVLIGAQLVARGSAHWTMNWTGPGTLVPPEGIALETIRDRADTAVRLPGQTQRLGLYVAALGMDERAPLPGKTSPNQTKPAGKHPPKAPRAQISIAPGVDAPAQRRISGVRVLALTVLLGMAGMSWLLWVNREERPYPGTGWQRVNPTATYDPAAGGAGLPGEVPGSGGYSGWPTTGPSYHLPTAPIWTPGTLLRPSIDIESLVPRRTR